MDKPLVSDVAPTGLATIRSILKKNGGEVWSLAPDATVYDAIAMMADKGVTTLFALSAGRIVGVVTEEDCASTVILKGKSFTQTRVWEIMTAPSATVTPNHATYECM